VKNTVITDATTRIYYLGPTAAGSHHDYALLKQELDPRQNWFKDIEAQVDLGYLGIQKDYTFPHHIHIPHKTPRKSKNNPHPTLTEPQKKHNKQLAQTRIKVEHAIGGMKVFQSLSSRFRHPVDGFIDTVVLLAAGLWNLKLSM
jgi:hypothetical protein